MKNARLTGRVMATKSPGRICLAETSPRPSSGLSYPREVLLWSHLGLARSKSLNSLFPVPFLREFLGYRTGSGVGTAQNVSEHLLEDQRRSGRGTGPFVPGHHGTQSGD